jgi:hypothetical protein
VAGVPPVQIVWEVAIAPAVGVAITVTVLLADISEQGDEPEVVSVRVATPLNPAGGVQLAFTFDALGENMPPAGVLHVTVVAPPPNEPPSAAVVPP